MWREMMIERDKNPVGRWYNALFGVACVLDGIVRVVSFGYLMTRLPLDVSRWGMERSFKKEV
jgi:hypothetical protein